jgi:hypothetical protein
MHKADEAGHEAGGVFISPMNNRLESGSRPPQRDSSPGKPVADSLGQRKICRMCVHYRMRPELVLFSAGELAAPGVLKARNQYDQQHTQRAFQEEQRLLSRQPFDYEPHHYPWCAFFTKESRVNQARAGDHEAFDELITLGGASLNPVTGEINPLYILCAWKNEHEDCEHFTPSDLT